MATKYDVALIEKPDVEVLTKSEVINLYDLLNSEEAYPIEIMANERESTAIGLISTDTANYLDYDFDNLSKYIADILDDINKENANCTYMFDKIRIWLSR